MREYGQEPVRMTERLVAVRAGEAEAHSLQLAPWARR